MIKALSIIVLLGAVVIGCSKPPSLDAQHRKAEQSREVMSDQGGRVDRINEKVADLQKELLREVDRAKSDPVESRVGAMVGQALDNNAPSEVQVYACASGPDRDVCFREASMTGRQLLMFAEGVDVIAHKGGSISTGSKSTIPGVRTSVLTNCGGYVVVGLQASVHKKIDEPLGGGVHAPERIARTARLESVVQDIMEAVWGTNQPSQTVGTAATNALPATGNTNGKDESTVAGKARVYLRKMQWVPQTMPPECTYELEVIRSQQ